MERDRWIGRDVRGVEYFSRVETKDSPGVELHEMETCSTRNGIHNFSPWPPKIWKITITLENRTRPNGVRVRRSRRPACVWRVCTESLARRVRRPCPKPSTDPTARALVRRAVVVVRENRGVSASSAARQKCVTCTRPPNRPAGNGGKNGRRKKKHEKN